MDDTYSNLPSILEECDNGIKIRSKDKVVTLPSYVIQEVRQLEERLYTDVESSDHAAGYVMEIIRKIGANDGPSLEYGQTLDWYRKAVSPKDL